MNVATVNEAKFAVKVTIGTVAAAEGLATFCNQIARLKPSKRVAVSCQNVWPVSKVCSTCC